MRVGAYNSSGEVFFAAHVDTVCWLCPEDLEDFASGDLVGRTVFLSMVDYNAIIVDEEAKECLSEE